MLKCQNMLFSFQKGLAFLNFSNIKLDFESQGCGEGGILGAQDEVEFAINAIIFIERTRNNIYS